MDVQYPVVGFAAQRRTDRTSDAYGRRQVACWFSFPADDCATKRQDLNNLLISDPLATFYLQVSGQSMASPDIGDGDLLVGNRVGVVAATQGDSEMLHHDSSSSMNELHQAARTTAHVKSLPNRKRPMTTVHVTAKRDFIETLVASKPIAALSEVIWNGFDAQSDEVSVSVELNELDGVAAVKIQDYGYGIDPSRIEALFGGLGESWKKAAYKQAGRALHGKNGKGRFKAFALGERVQWKTVYADKSTGKRYSYNITGHLNSLDDFEVTDPHEVDRLMPTGTEVSIHNMRHDFKSLKDGSALMELAKSYAAYLTEYPNLTLKFDGETVKPEAAQLHATNIRLENFKTQDGRIFPVTLSVIEWKVQTERVLHLCDPNGVALHAVQVGPQVRAPGFEFTAYIKSELFRDLDKINSLVLADLHPDVQQVMGNAKSKLKAHFRRRIAETQSEVIKKWKEEKIYPFEEKTHLDPIETAERQVFDILAVNVESYLPSFEDADHKSRKFTFQLLAYAVRENPDSVQTIISEVLGLKRAEQDDLAELLSKTTLSSIISAAKTVANRLDFLIALAGC